MDIHYDRVNTSRNQKRLKKLIEAKGYTDVEVWWEPLGEEAIMCGPSGGFFFSAEECELEPLGYSYAEAVEIIGYLVTLPF